MSARIAIRRVRFKAGGEMHLLPDSRSPSRARVERAIRAALDGAGDVAGFAFVAWDADNWSITARWCGPDSRIPGLLAPDYVRNRLLASEIESWTLETINDQNGRPPDDAS